MDVPCVIALGGGSFGLDGVCGALDSYILSQSDVDCPKICFLPTASGDAADYIVKFYAAFTDRRCVPSHLSLFRRGESDLRRLLLDQNIIYVGGGNTANLLAVWKVHGVDEILRDAANAGAILCGVSAGAICWFDSGSTDSFGLPLQVVRGGLGLVSGSCCPHYYAEKTRRPLFHKFIGEGTLPGGYAIDDGVAVKFVGGQVVDLVADSPGRCAWKVRQEKGTIIEEALETRLLVSSL